MAKKQTDLRLSYKHNVFMEGSFIQNKTSKFQPDIPGIDYYTKTRHTVGARPVDSFMSMFNSQVIPSIPPGVEISVSSPDSFRILTQFGDSIMTELGNYLILE